MGKRRTSRRLSMQALYQTEVSGTDIAEAINNLFEEEDFIPETKKFARELAKAAWKERAETDETIKQLAKGWPLDRIGKVDLSILRVAIYELKEGTTPQAIIINEAVELAKRYSTAEAAKFINGILGTYLTTVRPA